MKNINPNPDHNIWNNNGTYWCHYTVHGDVSALPHQVPLVTRNTAQFGEIEGLRLESY